MPLGALAPFPLRLGGTAKNGLTATQHARIAADYVALKRSAPLAVWTYTLASSAVTVHAYYGQDGAGPGFAWDYVVNGTGDVTWTLTRRSMEDPTGLIAPIHMRAAHTQAHGTSRLLSDYVLTASSIRVLTNDGSAAADAKVTVEVY